MVHYRGQDTLYVDKNASSKDSNAGTPPPYPNPDPFLASSPPQPLGHPVAAALVVSGAPQCSALATASLKS